MTTRLRIAVSYIDDALRTIRHHIQNTRSAAELIPARGDTENTKVKAALLGLLDAADSAYSQMAEAKEALEAELKDRT